MCEDTKEEILNCRRGFTQSELALIAATVILALVALMAIATRQISPEDEGENRARLRGSSPTQVEKTSDRTEPVNPLLRAFETSNSK